MHDFFLLPVYIDLASYSIAIYFQACSTHAISSHNEETNQQSAKMTCFYFIKINNRIQCSPTPRSTCRFYTGTRAIAYVRLRSLAYRPKIPAKDRGSGIFGISVQFFRAMSPEKIGTTLCAV